MSFLHLGNGDSGNPNGTTWFGHQDADPPAPPYVCPLCGHVERHTDPTASRIAAKAHWDDKHAEVA